MLASREAMATVPVKNLAKARSFYEKTLGLAPLPSDEPGVQGYRAGESTILVYESAFAGTNQATAVTWPLGKELDPVLKDLKSKGVAFEHYDIPGMTHEGDVHVAGDVRVAWFKDPDGNIFNVGNYDLPRGSTTTPRRGD
jgi:catechol 2,3-dioxygenase-like lactoylglutathione lyase family enzyme